MVHKNCDYVHRLELSRAHPHAERVCLSVCLFVCLFGIDHPLRCFCLFVIDTFVCRYGHDFQRFLISAVLLSVVMLSAQGGT